jgi:hypothetical protein
MAEAAEDGAPFCYRRRRSGQDGVAQRGRGGREAWGRKGAPCAGAEFEAALSFGGLSQLLGPILGQLDELDQIDQQALRVSLGLIDGTASEEQAVAIATLRLLTALASILGRGKQPVLKTG